MQIKQAEEEHKEELFKHHEICFRHHIEEIWGWDDTWQRDYFDKEWEKAEWRILLEGYQLIGYLVWRIESDHLYLLNISLLPEFRNQGLGKQAMAFIQSEADSMGLAIKLSTFQTNKRVIKFYLNLGFKVIEKVETGTRMSKGFGDKNE